MPRLRTAPPVRAGRAATSAKLSSPRTEMSNLTQAPEAQAPMKVEAHVETQGHDVTITIDTRRYRIRGLQKNLSPHQLRVNILATRDELVHMDTLDLYQARSRVSFIKATASELYVDEPLIKRDVGWLLLKLEQLQHEHLTATNRRSVAEVTMTEAERQAALDLLQDARLIDRILEDYTACGLVGEPTGKLVCYLACVSRLLAQPLAILIQSSSAAGKSSLMDATLQFVPPEHQLRYSAMTGQSLYYMGRQHLKHKILAVAEEEGVSQASYALKLLQSDGRLRIAAAGKSSDTGQQQTETYEIEGPVMMFLTTTSEVPDPELQNRCLTLQVNETSAQTAAIHARQRIAYTLDGQASAAERAQRTQRHQHAQRLLQRLPVVIPWAEQLTYRHDQIRMRRDHAKYLALIASITLLHQYQRVRRTRDVDGESVEYLEATLQDIELANRLATDMMGQSLDSLLPQTRGLLGLLDEYVTRRALSENKSRNLVRFTQRALREGLGWGDFQLRRHLARLVELEYVLVYRTGARNQREYELLYAGQGHSGDPQQDHAGGTPTSAKFVLGLVDVASLQEASLQEASLQEASLQEASLQEASLQEASPRVAPQHDTPQRQASTEIPPNDPPDGQNDRSESQNDHLSGQNDAHSMPLRSASDGYSSGDQNGVSHSSTSRLRRPQSKTRRTKVK